MPTSGSKPSRHPRRGPDVHDRLERNRERVRARRAQARQREKAITTAVKQYVAAWAAVAECESKRDRDIEVCHQQIRQLEARAEEELTGHRAQQAAAAAALRREGQSDDDVAELLEITAKQARQLISAARITDGSGPADGRGHARPNVTPQGRTPVDGPTRSSSETEPTAEGR